MLSINQIKAEAFLIRSLLEKYKTADLKCLTSEFPIGNCKLASLLLAYHILDKNPQEKIYGISGFAKNKNGEEMISHHWLEIGDVAVDITADQYNDIDDSQLNKVIIKGRPFNSIYVGKIGDIPHYHLFKIRGTDLYSYGFPDFHEDYLEGMEMTYKKIMSYDPRQNIRQYQPL